jgi:undecaprenyl-diphosphatase
VRPVALALVAGAITAATTLLVKFALARPDPHLTGTTGGSFPSGHTVSVVVCVGVAVHLLRPRAPGWVRAAPALVAGGVMGMGLVDTGAHWASDVLGGLALGLAVLSLIAAIDRLRPTQT